MAVSLADIKKLRDITGAGMMDVKKALEEANGDFEVAKDLLRKRGQAIAAKRSDREASEGCVLAKAENGFGAIVAVKCETATSPPHAAYWQRTPRATPTSPSPIA